MAKKEAEEATWEKLVQADEKRATLAPGPLLEPVERWFRRRKKGKGALAAAHAVAAGLWTQAKSHGRGLTESPFCVACLKEGREVRGDAKHRLTECSCFKDERKNLLPTWRHQAETSADRWLWDRGLVKDPSKNYTYVLQVEDIKWHVADGVDALFTGDVASDGSRIGNWRGLGCTGTAAVQPGDCGQSEQVVAWGPLPTSLPVQRRIARAELFCGADGATSVPAAGGGARRLLANPQGQC